MNKLHARTGRCKTRHQRQSGCSRRVLQRHLRSCRAAILELGNWAFVDLAADFKLPCLDSIETAGPRLGRLGRGFPMAPEPKRSAISHCCLWPRIFTVFSHAVRQARGRTIAICANIKAARRGATHHHQTKRGSQRLEWQNLPKRNEALDCRIYLRAAASIAGADRWTEATRRDLERHSSRGRVLENEQSVGEAAPSAPIAGMVRRAPRRQAQRVFDRLSRLTD